MGTFQEKIRTQFRRLDGLGEYREPVLFLGAGFLGGLLLFLSWWGMLPARNHSTPRPATAVATSQAPLSPTEGVLSGITGASDAQQATVVEPRDANQVDADPSAQASGSPGADPEVVGATDLSAVNGEDQAAATGALDAAVPARDPGGAEMRTYYVEVMREPGVSELLEVNAESVEHALAILRDFRGNPKIIRGPSTQPLD